MLPGYINLKTVYMEDLINELREEIGVMSASLKILFKELEISIIILEKVREEIINSPLLNNITRNTKKQPCQHRNRYLQIRDEQFKIFMKLFESMNLTPKKKDK